MTKTLTTDEFKEKIFNYEVEEEWKFLGNKPAIIDFYADWCVPCQVLSPIIDELSDKYDGKIDFYKINVDENQELTMGFGIRSIPSLIFIPMVGTPQIASGVIPKEKLVEYIDDFFNLKEE